MSPEALAEDEDFSLAKLPLLEIPELCPERGQAGFDLMPLDLASENKPYPSHVCILFPF